MLWLPALATLLPWGDALECLDAASGEPQKKYCQQYDHWSEVDFCGDPSITDPACQGEVMHADEGGCLQGVVEVVPVADRKLTVFTDPETGDTHESPIGFHELRWSSAYLAKWIAMILIEEVLGIQTKIHTYSWASAVAHYSIAGCPENEPDQCIPGSAKYLRFSQSHVIMEAWRPETPMATIAGPGGRPPLMRTNLGYPGFESVFVVQNQMDRAYDDLKVPIEFYKTWSNSHWDLTPYFSKIPDFNVTADLTPIADTNMVFSNLIEIYLELTDDTDGVTVTTAGDGTKTYAPSPAAILDGYWWLAPACRSDPTTCIPLVTGGNGWFTEAFMQRAATYHLPWAIAVTASWSKYLTVPMEYSIAMYAWTPDDSFVENFPTKLGFPLHDSSAFLRQDFRTDSGEIDLWIMTHEWLQSASPLVDELLVNFDIPFKAMNDMVYEAKVSGEKKSTSACRWLRRNVDHWKAWIPDRTLCAEGQGLSVENADGSVEFVDGRVGRTGVGCSFCKAGSFSQEFTDAWDGAGGTRTRTCIACPKGTMQAEPGTTECLGCEPGKFAADIMSTACALCETGTFEPDVGSPKCEACDVKGLMKTTILGSTTAADCRCPAKMYASNGARDTCLDCPEGMVSLNIEEATSLVEQCVCPKDEYMTENLECIACPDGLSCEQGSDIKYLNLRCQSEEGDGTIIGEYPKPTLGYFTTCVEVCHTGDKGSCRENGLDTYRCLSPEACPGGDLDTCGLGRSQLVCGTCAIGTYQADEGCVPCPDSGPSLLVFPVMPILLGPMFICILYKFSQDGVEKWMSPGNNFATLLYVSLVYFQTIAAHNKLYINQPKIMQVSFGWTTYSTEFLTVLRPSCAFTSTWVSTFTMSLLIPIYAVVFFFCVYLGNYIVALVYPDLRMQANILMNCFGSLYNTFFIGIAQQTFMLFQCYKHPNGAWSLRSRGDILCYANPWNDVVVASVLAIIVFCGGCLATFTYVICVAPRRFSNTDFRMRFKFLFLKFRPNAYWWALVMLVKGVWISLTTVLFSVAPDQIAWLAAGTIMYLFITTSLFPWRSVMVAVIDNIMHIILTFLLGFLPYLNFEATSAQADHVGVAYVVISYIPALPVACGLLLMAYKRIVQEKPPNRMEESKQLVAAFEKMKGIPVEMMSEILQLLPWKDRRDLKNAKDLLLSEIFDVKDDTMSSRLGTGKSKSFSEYQKAEIVAPAVQSVLDKTANDQAEADQPLQVAQIQMTEKDLDELSGL